MHAKSLHIPIHGLAMQVVEIESNNELENSIIKMEEKLNNT
jgi:hypothetical protein